jgi:hypothetical protein
LILLVLVLLACSSAGAAEPERLGSVVKVEGRAIITPAGKKRPVPLRPDDPLRHQDRVSTKSRSKLLLSLICGDAAIRQNTSLTLAKQRIRLILGSFGFDSGRRTSAACDITTPDAEIRLTGTRLAVAVSAGSTRIVVFEGIVEVESLSIPGDKVTLGKNQTIVVRKGVPLPSPENLRTKTSLVGFGSGSRLDIQSGGMQIDDPRRLAPGTPTVRASPPNAVPPLPRPPGGIIAPSR